MAIDSKEKRASVLGVARPWMRDKFPVATPDEEWRASSANSYGGNALSAGAAVLISQARSVGRFVFGRLFGRVN